MERLPPEVARRLGHYVYLYVDPRDNQVFYVGKGVGERLLAHLGEAGESHKVRIIEALKEEGREPRIEVLAHQLPNEETALRIEAAIIDFLGLDKLTNQVRGWKSVEMGRLPLAELVAYYAATPVVISEPAILIRINRLYRHGMSADELYEATRGVWKLSERRRGVTHAFAVFESVVRAVYLVSAWHPAGTTPYQYRPASEVMVAGRWEFTGTPAPPEKWSRYVGHSVAAYFKKGAQSPIAYVNA